VPPSTLPMLQDILQLPAFRGAEVLSGQLRLQQPVTWVHVSELLDVARLLSGGELLLSTGLELFRSQPSVQQTYLSSLAEISISGLVLELVQWQQELPPELLQTAQKLGLPLIVFRSEVRFAELTRAAHQRILRPPAMQESLMDCVVKALIETGYSDHLIQQQLGSIRSVFSPMRSPVAIPASSNPPKRCL
jgi:hypothetical protein